MVGHRKRCRVRRDVNLISLKENQETISRPPPPRNGPLGSEKAGLPAIGAAQCYQIQALLARLMLVDKLENSPIENLRLLPVSGVSRIGHNQRLGIFDTGRVKALQRRGRG